MRIAFTGPESCGKSTLATWMSQAYQLPLCEEYARKYLELDPNYDFSDLDKICEGQIAAWTKLGNTFVADTEMTVIKIWSEFRFHRLSNLILKEYSNQRFDHYFLCAPDIPWQQDPLRENPDNRDELFELYLAELNQMKRPFSVLSGNFSQRQKVCQMVMSGLLNS